LRLAWFWRASHGRRGTCRYPIFNQANDVWIARGYRPRAAYEIYAHVAIAEHDKLPDAKLATIVAGQRPPDLTRDEAVAYDVAAALTGGGPTYRAAVDAFGVHGAAELGYLVGLCHPQWI
jgi:4-carboxymuconolactone decarboxylase